ncbi:MAG: orotate phosphoribosyltransferase [Bacteroidota bacterium]
MQIYDDQVAGKISSELLRIQAIKLRPNDPFTWASGWKSPIYCDNRLSLSFPEVRTYVKNALADLIKSKYPDADAIAGVATAGIPQGALVADLLELPFIYVRSKSKEHGMGNQIEGLVRKEMKVVMLEDLVSTGGSSLLAAEAVKAAEMEVLGMVSIFTYGFPVAEENFEKQGIELWCLSDYNHLIEVASKNGQIDAQALGALRKWREDPGAWKG